MLQRARRARHAVTQGAQGEHLERGGGGGGGAGYERRIAFHARVLVPTAAESHVSQPKCERKAAAAAAADAQYKLGGIAPCSGLQLRLAQRLDAGLYRLLVAGEGVCLLPQLACGVLGCLLQGRGRVQRFFVSDG